MATKNLIKNELTEGVIWKQLLLFFFPIMFGTFFQQFYNTIDAIVVGRFVSSNALAAVGGSSSQIINLIVGFFTGLTSGAAVIVSQFFGSGDREKVNRAMHTIYAFSILGSIVITIFGIMISPVLLEVMNTPAEIMEDSLLYLRVYFSGVFFVFIYNTGASLLRALGDSRRPLIYLIICCFVNVALDLILVVGFGLGVAGVAIATLIAQAISAALTTYALIRSRQWCDFSLRNIRMDMSMLKPQLYIGLPGGVQGSMYSLSNMILQVSVNNIGTAAIAAWAAHGKVDAVFWMINGSLGIAVTTFVGQNYGAGLMDRVKKSVRIGLCMDLGFAIIASILLIVFRVPLFSLFTDDPLVLQIAADTLMIIAPFYAAFTFIEIYSCALRGMGDVVIPMIMTMLGICGFRILWVLFVVPLAPTMETISFNYPISWGITGLCYIVYYRMKVKRMEKKLERKNNGLKLFGICLCLLIGTLGITGCNLVGSQSSDSLPAQYIRTYHNANDDSSNYLITTLIQSKEELDAYYEANKDVYSLGHHEDTAAIDDSIGFIDACEKYTEEYFEENKLVLISLMENSGSISHQVKGITHSSNELSILIERFHPDGQTDDMMGWHIFVELEDFEELPEDINIDVSFEDVYEDDSWWN